MSNLNYIGCTDYTTFECNSSIPQVVDWINSVPAYQLDVESNVVKGLVERELKVVQFGDIQGENVYVIQWSSLTTDEQEMLIRALNDSRPVKIIHNAAFEYTLLNKYGVILEHVWDTFVQEKYLYAGHPYDNSYFSLAETLMRRYQIDMSKAMQTQFGDDMLDNDKIIYAATDVLYMGRLYLDQKKDLIARGKKMGMSKKTALKVSWWENEALLGFCDMMCEGFTLDVPRWVGNVDKATPIIEDAKVKLRETLLYGEFSAKSYALDVNAKISLGHDDEISDSGEVLAADNKKREFKTKAILPNDTMLINWNSGPQKLEVLNLVFPDLESGATVGLRDYLQKNDPLAPQVNNHGKKIGANSKFFVEGYMLNLAPDKYSLLKLVALKQFKQLEDILVLNFKDKLIELGYFFEKDSLMLNWNSNPQKLAVFQWFDPNITSCDAQCVEDHLHVNKFFPAFRQYTDANSLLTKFGIGFIANNVEADGRVRTRIDQIKSTGRISSSHPNLQQIPANALPDGRKNDYRNCFTPNYPEWLILSSDYDS